MFLVTRKNNASKAAASWYRTYYRNGKWSEPNQWIGDPKVVHERLVVLGDNPDPDAVDRIIGNKSWTECECDDCGRNREELVSMGQDPGYESNTAKICKDCLKAAVKLL